MRRFHPEVSARMRAWMLSLVSVLVVSLVSLVGVLTLGLSPSRLRKLSSTFVAFAVGALLGDVFFHLLPEMVDRTLPMSRAAGVLGGIVLFFVLEKVLRQRHRFHHARHHGRAIPRVKEVAAINLVGDALHNFIDGLVLGASYLVSPAFGAATTLAILAHEIPQEMGDFGVLVHSGLSVRRAVAFNLASASLAILGTVLALLLGGSSSSAVASALLPLAAGGFLYLALADLIPELHHEQRPTAVLTQTLLIVLGMGTMAALTLFE